MNAWPYVFEQNSMVSGVCGSGTFWHRGGRKLKGIQEEAMASYSPHRYILIDLLPPTWPQFPPSIIPQ